MFEIRTSGSFKNMESFLRNVGSLDIRGILEKAARDGVDALSRATPIESGLAAKSWGYEISSSNGVHTISWTNSDVEDGFPVVIMLQYGHGTGTGGYVSGQDFINPALQPIFDRISETVWKAVKSA